MAVSRYRARTRLARWWAAAAICLLALVCAGGLPRQAGAIGEAVVDFHIVQLPAAPATVQVGSSVTFVVNVSATASTTLFFDFDYPSGLQWVSGASNPAGVLCTNNSPSAGVVRCSYGTIPAGAIAPLTLTFNLTADATVSDEDFRMLSFPLDGAPDLIDGVGDTFIGGGTLTAFTAGMFPASGSAAASAFEGAQVAYPATLTNNAGVDTGAFNASIEFAGGSVSAVSCGSGVASGEASSTATCTGSDIPVAGTLGVTANVRPADSADGTDIQPALMAPALGITSASLSPIDVREVGLENTGPATLAIGHPVNVCTAAVTAEVPDRATLGHAQPGNGALLAGSFSGNPLLQLADFSVTGPGVGTITAATGCAADQSGVRFTPSLGGVYTVTARYNIGGAEHPDDHRPRQRQQPGPHGRLGKPGDGAGRFARRGDHGDGLELRGRGAGAVGRRGTRLERVRFGHLDDGDYPGGRAGCRGERDYPRFEPNAGRRCVGGLGDIHDYAGGGEAGVHHPAGQRGRGCEPCDAAGGEGAGYGRDGHLD